MTTIDITDLLNQLHYNEVNAYPALDDSFDNDLDQHYYEETMAVKTHFGNAVEFEQFRDNPPRFSGVESVQAWGKIDGRPFYFRTRGPVWLITLYEETYESWRHAGHHIMNSKVYRESEINSPGTYFLADGFIKLARGV